ncbi:MAG: MBL fold metallo-hydrolase [Candidatus Deferrimicrobiaceae bacterium]
MFKVDVVEDGVLRFVMSRQLFGKDLYRSACYLAGDLLVDSGIAHRKKDFVGSLSGIPVSTIVNTHAHEDHMGANAILQKKRRIPVYAHEKALPTLSNPKKLSLLPYQRFFFGEPSPSLGQPVGDTVLTERHAFQVLHSPGHSPDHIVLFEKSRGWIFSGDAFIGGQDRVFRESYDIWGITRTLRMLSALEAEIMFTGMGNVLRKPTVKIRRKLSYFEEISNKIETLHREGIEASEIAKRLFPGDSTVRLVTSGDFSSAHLVRAIIQLTGNR